MATAERRAPLAVSPEEFLAAERLAEEKSEYYDGEIVAFSGASLPHNALVFNLAATLGPQLRGKPCQGFPSDLRVWNQARRSYMYPDVVVVCGEPLFQDGERDVVLNPTLLVEVLSPSTERNDRGRKAEVFRQIPSLQEYLFVRQDAVHVEHFRRYAPLQWMLTETTDLEARVDLPSIGCTLPLRDLYDRVL